MTCTCTASARGNQEPACYVFCPGPTWWAVYARCPVHDDAPIVVIWSPILERHEPGGCDD